MTALPNLFTPTKLGTVELSNKFIMAPLTRTRATPYPDFQPGALMAEHYASRASHGLIIAEATAVTDYSAFNGEPGLFTAKQAEGWKLTTDAVHANGGKIFAQLFHPGRAAHTTNSGGKQAVAPSAKACGGGHQIQADFLPSGEKGDYEVPRALELEELPKIVELFANAARLAKDAGFDGVEIHGANGYLLDSFLRDSANERTDAYGGSLENRARLLLEVTAAVTKVWPSQQVGVRISPLNSFQDMKDSNPVALTEYVTSKLSELHIGYLCLVRGDLFQVQTGDVVTPARKNFKNGQLMVNLGLTVDEAEESIAKGVFDLACFGRLPLANPDFVARAKAGAKQNEVDWSTTYTKTAVGYTDYPYMTEADLQKKAE
jgi:N-ethylmaleimide reductase